MSALSRRTSFAFLMATLPGIPFVPAAALPVVAPAVACVYFVTPVPCAAQTPAAIPDGAEVHFEIQKDLKSGGSKAGEDVPFTVSRDVYSSTYVFLAFTI